MLYDVALGLVWAVMLPLFLLAGVLKPRLARKALSLSTVGLTRLSPTGSGRQRVLVHGVSVGGIKASQSLVHALQERYEVVVSAFSDTGMQVARQLFPEIEVVRYPFDFAPIVTRFWRLVCPDFVLLVELEAWPCFLRAANPCLRGHRAWIQVCEIRSSMALSNSAALVFAWFFWKASRL